MWTLRVAHEHPDHRDLRAPVVGEAAEVRDDELDVGVLAREQLDGLDLAHHVVEHGDAGTACHVADLAGDASVVAVHLDAAEAVLLDRLADERQHPARVADRMDEREAVQPAAGARRTIRATRRLATA